MIASLVQRLEDLFFGHRAPTLGTLLAFTLLMAVFAAQLKMDAGFDKQLPQGHEYIQTFNQYRDEVFGANRIIVVVHPRQGEIWTAEGCSACTRSPSR
jgi:Predicted exporters of the RND superfamily